MSELTKRKKPMASGKSTAKSKKKGFDTRYALPSQEEQQVLRQIGLDAATLSKTRARAAGAVIGGGDADLKNSLMGGGEDSSAGAALAQSGLEVAHNSNLWGIQTTDLLKEETFDYDHTAALTDALRSIKAAVDSIPVPEEPVSRDSVDPRFMCTFLRRNDAADAGADQTPVSLNFAPPSAVDIVGSFLIRTQVRGPGANVDMALEMPDSCLDAKDYLNNRYFEKRALFLAVIAEHLEQEVGQQFDVRVSHFRDDERKTMLVLRAKEAAEGDEGDNDAEDEKKSKKKKKKKKKKKRSKVESLPEIRILATVSPNCQTLTVKRLRPGRTNVRVYGHTYGAPGTPEGALPTPHYSSAIVEDMCFKTHLQQLHVVAQKYPGFPGAVVLLKLWLSRRRYNCRSVGDAPESAHQSEEVLVTDTDCAGVTGFHLSMVLLHLVWQNKVQVHMQPLQMFRVVLQFLGQRKSDADVVASTGIVMCPRDKLGEAKLPTADELTELRSLFDVVMLECASPLNTNVRLNIAARVSREALTDLAWEARRSVELLQNGDPVLGFEDGYQSGPSKKNSKKTKATKKNTSDASLARQSENHPVNDSLALVEAACDYGWRRACEVRLAKLIRRGLGNRLQGFRIVRFQETPLPLHRRRRLTGTGEIDNRGENAGHTVVLGLLLDDDEAFRQIDKGPPATDKAAVRAFRLFWGTRAELRRFKDGSILETVLWGPSDAPPRLAHQLPGVILTHLLNRHFAGCSAVSTASALDHLVRTREMDVQAPPDDVNAANSKSPSSRTGNVETGDTLGGGGRGEEVVGRTLALLMEFRRLETLLKNISGVELKVEDVRPAAPEFAYASLMPPRGVPTSVDSSVHLPAHALMAPLRVVVSFEASMRWPGTNSKALATCKSAFYLKMADALRRSKAVERARPLQDALEVQLRHTNVLFHIVIGLERAWEFAAKEADEEAVAKAEKRAAPAASQALQVRAANKRAIARRKEAALGFQRVPALEREERHRVFHVGVLHGLAVQHRSFSPAVRLAKLWVARSMLSGHVPDEAVELLVAHTFADPGPFDEPHGAAAALLRFFKLVSTFDWRGEPLIVDLDRAAAGRGHSNSRKKKQRFFGAANATATTAEERGAIRAAFRRLRDQRPQAAAMCIVGPSPPRSAEASIHATHLVGCKGPLWTMHKPGPTMLQRLVKLAAAAAQQLQDLLESPAQSSAALAAACDRTIFASPPADAFDVTLNLKSNADLLQELAYGASEAAAAQRLRKKFKNAPQLHLSTAIADEKWPAGFNPVKRFAEELSAALGAWAVVCYNAFDLDTIGIIWRPARFMPAAFKLSHASCTTPVCLLSTSTATESEAPARKKGRRNGNGGSASGGPASSSRTHTVPDIFQLLATAQSLGDGLIDSVHISGAATEEQTTDVDPALAGLAAY